MATSLDEQIIDLVATKLATITTGNGYEQTVAGVVRPPEGFEELESVNLPGLILIRRGKTPRYHLRGAEEFTLELLILCVTDGTVADPHEANTDLAADVKKLCYSNQLWNNGSANLAVRTRIIEDRQHDVEVPVDRYTSAIVLEITARSTLANPYITKTI